MLDFDRERSRTTALHMIENPELRSLSTAICAASVQIPYGMHNSFVQQQIATAAALCSQERALS
jgi:hypothetical protein